MARPGTTDPPQTPTTFAQMFPELQRMHNAVTDEAAREGPLDAEHCQLIRLAFAIGAQAGNSVRSQTARALAMGIQLEAIRQVVALSLGALGSAAAISAAAWTGAELGLDVR